MYEFRLPDLGEGIHEGEVLRWHVRPGELIREDDPLVDVETDKAAVTIPSPRTGRVVSLGAREGETVQVGQVLVILDTGEVGTAAPGPSGTGPTQGAEVGGTASPPKPPGTTERPESRGEEEKPGSQLPPSPGGKSLPVAAAPATRRLARELGIDIRRVPGSGPGGRVTAEDVRRFAEHGVADRGATEIEPGPEERPPVGAAVPGATGIPYLDLEPLPDFARWGEVVREPVRSIRRKVARNMVTSMVLIPHVAHMDEADVTDLEAFRHQENIRRGTKGPRLTLLAFVVRAVTIALKRHPVFNATLDPFREEITYKRYYHIGIAVDTERGLIVPNIKDADRLSIEAIASRIEELARQAREGRIALEDLRGGSFSITNIGVLGGTSFVPAIHYPESAILGTGRASPKPVVRQGQVVVRTMLPMTLSFDHRIADGAQAARFVSEIRDLLENPVRLAVEG